MLDLTIDKSNFLAKNDSIDLSIVDKGLGSYIKYVNSIPMLSLEDEVMYAKDYFENKNKESANMLILSHLRVVVKVASNFSRYGVSMMELISEGNYGLVRAVEKFDYTKGFRFVTYALWWVRAAIKKYVSDSFSIVKSGIKHVSGSDVSIDSEMENVLRYDSIGVEDSVEISIQNKKIKFAIEKLNEREREIFCARFFEKKTLDELSSRFQISKERVRQLQNIAFLKVKKICLIEK